MAGLALEWPFVSQPDYVGPLVRALGGADISWVVGWFSSAAVYLLLMRGVAGRGAARVSVAGAPSGTGPA